jgi:hypothetical protein
MYYGEQFWFAYVAKRNIMKRLYLIVVLLLFAAALAVGIPGDSRAASSLSVSMYSTRGYHVTGDATTDDGGGVDYICVVCLNSDGSPKDVDVLSFPLGTIDATGGCDSRPNFPTDVPPYSVSVYDVTGPYSQEDTPGGLAYCESFAPPSSSPSSKKSADVVHGPGPDMIYLPEWAVVGTFTQTTLLYYYPAPGAESDSTMYIGQSLWVLGLDHSGMFYQVVLSGKYLWVPVDTIGPTYGDPWYGRPLPTEVIDA